MTEHPLDEPENPAEALNVYCTMGRVVDDDDERLHDVCERLAHEAADRVHELAAETPLSQREAETVALKGQGLTHYAIHQVYRALGPWPFGDDYSTGPGDSVPQVAAIHTYSRRARDKYRAAVSTVRELDALYGDAAATPPKHTDRATRADFAARLWLHRDARDAGISQVTVAEALGVSQAAVSKAIRDRRDD